jgi:hypothetical protein
MRSVYKILLKLCQILAWVLAFIVVPILSALWIISTVAVIIIFQMLLTLHPSLGRKVDHMFQVTFLDYLFPSK